MADGQTTEPMNPEGTGAPLQSASIAPVQSPAVKASPAQKPPAHTKSGGKAPSDAELKKARADAARAANLALGREVRAEHRAQAKAEGKPDPAPPPRPLTREMAELGARQFVRLSWMISSLILRLFSYRLRDLTDDELAEGAKECIDLVSRWRWIITLCAFVGFPLWLFNKARSLAEKILPGEKPAKPAPSNVHPIGNVGRP